MSLVTSQSSGTLQFPIRQSGGTRLLDDANRFALEVLKSLSLQKTIAPDLKSVIPVSAIHGGSRIPLHVTATQGIGQTSSIAICMSLLRFATLTVRTSIVTPAEELGGGKVGKGSSTICQPPASTILLFE